MGTQTISIEYRGERLFPPPEMLQRGGGSAPAEILPNLIAVTKLTNAETLDVAKKDNFYT